MPAMVAHYLFAQRVFSNLHKIGIPVTDRAAANIGAQGPDIFFFHRVLPWQLGTSYVREGQRMHKISPARLFDAFRSMINRQTDAQKHDVMLSYVEGFFCHYALDRAAHPFILYWQEHLREEQPRYGTTDSQYHFRIESALETMTLRRETGRLMRDFSLTTVLPTDRQTDFLTIGRLYQPVFAALLGSADATAEHIALAPGDMRQALLFMTDKSMIRQRLIHPLERLVRKGHIGTSLLRPLDTGDWDYANEAHRLWTNPFDDAYSSNDSFFDIYELAAAEATDMITAFLEGLSSGTSMVAITQDRGFSSDLPGIYEIK